MIPPDGLNLRAAPGTQYPTIDLIPGGTRIGITGTANDAGWYPAVYKGNRGWVRGDFIDLPSDAAVTTRRAAVRGVEAVLLRTEPHHGSSSLTAVPAGMAITISVRTSSDGWVLAAFAGLTGWVAVESLQIEGSPPPPAVPAAPSPSGALSPSSVAVTTIMGAPGAGVRGTITYYHPSLEGGPMACGGRYRAEDPTIAAATSWPCGAKLRVCRNAACVVVTVQDTGHMGPNWVDLSSAAFRQLAPLPEMMVFGTIEVVPPGP